jgi:hypothetical protein
MASSTGTPKSNASFPVADVVRVLQGLKDAAAAAGTDRWWDDALTFDWSTVRDSEKTRWVTIYYRPTPGALKQALHVRAVGEVNSGMIMPNTDADVAEMQAKFPAKKGDTGRTPIAKRAQKPCVQIRAWRGVVETEADGITVKKDAAGEPIYPPESSASMYYKFAALLASAFEAEVEALIAVGDAYSAAVAAEKKKGGKAPVVAAVAAAVPRPAIMILREDALKAIRATFAPGTDLNVLTKNAIQVTASKIVNFVQTLVGPTSTSVQSRGKALPNPIARVSLAFNQETGAAITKFYDKSKRFVIAGNPKPQFQPAMVDGKPVNADTIHRFIEARSIIDMNVEASSVCFSQMGISIPAKITMAIVEPAPPRVSQTTDDFYDGLELPPMPVAEASAEGAAAEGAAAEGESAQDSLADGFDELNVSG